MARRRIDSRDVSAHSAVGKVRGPRRAALGALLAALALLALAPPAHAQVSFSGPTNYLAGDGAVSVAAGDFNADRHPDLAVGQQRPRRGLVLLRGAGGFRGRDQLPRRRNPWGGDRRPQR